MNDRFKYSLRSLRERHGRFYTYPIMERFERRDPERRCFTHSGARRRAERLNKQEDTVTHQIGYWAMDGSEGWYPSWLAFWDKFYTTFGPVVFWAIIATEAAFVVQVAVLVRLFTQ